MLKSLAPVLSKGHAALRMARHGAQASRTAVLGMSYASKAYPPHTKVLMPALSPTMTSGVLASWNKKIGDTIAAGDSIASIETDKATMDFEYQDDGILAKILVQPGPNHVEVNSPIAIIAFDKKDVDAFADYTLEAAADTSGPAKEEPAASAVATAASTAAPASDQAKTGAAAATTSSPFTDSRVKASPVARKLASERGIDLTKVAGTGPGGRIIKEDILNFVETAPAAAAPAVVSQAPQPAKGSIPQYAPPPVPTTQFTEIPVSTIRRVIASRLTESKQTIPHYYLTMHVNMDKVLGLRKKLNEKLAKSGSKLSVNDFVIKASAKALLEVPEVNSSWADTVIRRFHHADISVAVATENGLITPIVFNAEQLGLSGISSAVRDLATRAKAGKLGMHEYQGGSFTISNLGMFGTNQFAAVINPPQSAILAVGDVAPTIVVGEDGATPVVQQRLTVTLSCDHRVIDGAVGAQWLQVFKGYLEDPETLLL